MTRNHAATAAVAHLCDHHRVAMTYTDGEIVIDCTARSDEPGTDGGQWPPLRLLHNEIVDHLRHFGFNFAPVADTRDIAATHEGITIVIPDGRPVVDSLRARARLVAMAEQGAA